MIDENNISVPVLCTLQFREPAELDLYPEQAEYYVPKISGIDLNVQVLCDKARYTADDLYLAFYSDRGYKLYKEKMTRHELVANVYYYATKTIAKATINALPKDTVGVFRIENNASTPTVYAESVIYKLNPTSTTGIKVLSYAHDENDWNVVFGSDTFYLSVECGYIPSDRRQEQETEDFTEQNMTNQILYGDTYEVKPLTWGMGLGIPYWLARKIDMATLCETVKVNGEEVTRIKGAKMEKVEATQQGLGIYKIDVQSTINYLQ